MESFRDYPSQQRLGYGYFVSERNRVDDSDEFRGSKHIRKPMVPAPIGATANTNAAAGAPTASLVTTGNNSWVVAVGNDYSNAIARTLGPGQTLVHQDLTSTGDTYWVQRETNAVSASGTQVTINDTAPTKDSYNLAIVEILAAGGTGVPPTVAITSPASGALLSGHNAHCRRVGSDCRLGFSSCWMAPH